MRLKKLGVSRFRSIKQEETLLVDQKVTILIGANDHGKTNILAAIQYLNDDKAFGVEDKNWDSDDQSIAEITWHFSVSPPILEKLKKLCPVTDVVPSADSSPTPADGSQSSVETAAVTSVQTFPINENGDVVFSRNSQTNTVKVVSLPVNVLLTNEQAVLALRPRVEVFESPSGNFVDQVTLEQLGTAPFEFMQGIFRQAGIWEIRDSIFTQNDKTSKILDEASLKLTQILNQEWNQGKELKWKLEHTGTNGDHIGIKIQDPAIAGRYTRPSLRSSGFRTYFLLSMIIYARTQNNAANSYFYLFDEPGTYLHPQAQLDLQRSFESIADNAQIMYTTHSLFLVNKNYPKRNRVISKTAQGTKIDQKPFTKNWKSVRQSLGILLSNNFLIAERTLLVEGPSDVIYLLDSIKKLKASKAIDIDLNAFSVVDAGDSENYVAMAKLMLSEGRNIVALLDGDAGGRTTEAQLKKTCSSEIAKGLLSIFSLPSNKSSEDVFADFETLKMAVRKVYDELIQTKVRVPKPGLAIDDEINGISTSPGCTLGRTLDQATRSWFDPKDKISKLSIALAYEDLGDVNTGSVSEMASEILKKVGHSLDVRGEKSMEPGVFEEA